MINKILNNKIIFLKLLNKEFKIKIIDNKINKINLLQVINKI